jgi:DAPG hydrolase PhiG domain
MFNLAYTLFLGLAASLPLQTPLVAIPTGPLALKDAPLLLTNEHLPFEAGFGISSDGLRHIAASTYMRGVTSDMIEWFFGWANTTEQYLYWHPRDHVKLEFVPPKTIGTTLQSKYVGGSHLVEEYIGGDLMSMNITFQDPSRYFGPNWKQEFKEHNYGAAICARVALYDQSLKSSMEMGHIIHLIHNEPDGVRMRSRFWLGDIDIPGLDAASIIPENSATGLAKHCPEEMAILATVLPRLWREYSEEGKNGAQTGFEKTDLKSKSYQGPAGVKV